jgi:hypothetical protein
MLAATLHPVRSEALRERVRQTLKQHWIKPDTPDDSFAVPRSQVDMVSRAALDNMLTRPFRVGPLPSPEVYNELLVRVRRKVRRGQPIHVTVGYAPLKNLHAVQFSRAEWAEFFALCRLAVWHKKVQSVYPPGLRIRIAFDDSTLIIANHADKQAINSYIESIERLIPALSLERLIVSTIRHSAFAWLFYLGLYQLAACLVRRWERNPANQVQLERMVEFARRNVVLPSTLPPEHSERYIRQASHRYRVYWEALQLSGVTHTRGTIVAMYLDGGQHHIRQSVALHLTSVDKGQVTQPWQGEGVLLDNGHGKLEPFVLTAGRRERYLVETVAGLDVLPGSPFDHIAVVRLKGAGDHQAVPVPVLPASRHELS